MAAQLTEKFETPGKIGASAQWCHKLVARYPQLGDCGNNLMEKTVTISVNLFKNLDFTEIFSSMENYLLKVKRNMSSQRYACC